MRWVRDPRPVDPGEFLPHNGLRRTLLPGQRLVKDQRDGQWYLEEAQLDPVSTPLADRLHHTDVTPQRLKHG